MKRELLQRSFLVLLIYLLISSPWVWPWYVTWLLPFLPFALDMGTGYVERVLLFSFGLLGNYFIWFYRWPFNQPTNDDNELIVYWLAFVPIIFVSLAIWSYQVGARLGRSAPGPAPARRARAAGVRSERV